MPATSHVRCHTAIIPGFGRPRQEDSIKFKANMSYLRRFCIKKKKKKSATYMDSLHEYKHSAGVLGYEPVFVFYCGR